MAEFYDHPSGKLHFKALAGGGTSIWDAPATEHDIKMYSSEHEAYLLAKRAAAEKAKSETDHQAAASEAKDIIGALSEEKTLLQTQVDHLSSAAEKL
jgi:hypothetical protein